MTHLYRRYTLSTITITFLLLISIVGFNYTVDSAEIFRPSNGVSFAAKAIASGHNIVGLENYDDRLFQKQVFDNFAIFPDCIIIGSSRTMMIQSHMIKDCKKVFNHSVSGSFFEDYLATVGMYDQKNILPKKILLGIDPWVFNAYNGPHSPISLTKEYQHLLGKIKKKHSKNNIEKNIEKNTYLQLINYDNTKNNLLHLKNKNKIVAVSDQNINSGMKRSDGSILYPAKIRFQSDKETQEKARQYLIRPIYNVENYKTISNLKIFQNFINYLIKQNVEVIFILPPYHPIVYDYFKKNSEYHNILKIESYLRAYAKKNNITILGSYNPYLYGFSSSDFTDGMHGKSSVVEKILLLEAK